MTMPAPATGQGEQCLCQQVSPACPVVDAVFDSAPGTFLSCCNHRKSLCGHCGPGGAHHSIHSIQSCNKRNGHTLVSDKGSCNATASQYGGGGSSCDDDGLFSETAASYEGRVSELHDSCVLTGTRSLAALEFALLPFWKLPKKPPLPLARLQRRHRARRQHSMLESATETPTAMGKRMSGETGASFNG